MKAIAIFGIGPIQYPPNVQEEINKYFKRPTINASNDLVLSWIEQNRKKKHSDADQMLTDEVKLSLAAARALHNINEFDTAFWLGSNTRKDIGYLKGTKNLHPNPSEAQAMREYGEKTGFNPANNVLEEVSENTLGNIIQLMNLLEEYSEIKDAALICSAHHKFRIEMFCNGLRLNDKTNFEVLSSSEVINSLEPTDSELRSNVQNFLDPDYKFQKHTAKGTITETSQQRLEKEAWGILAFEKFLPYSLPDLLKLNDNEHLARILQGMNDFQGTEIDADFVEKMKQNAERPQREYLSDEQKTWLLKEHALLVESIKNQLRKERENFTERETLQMR